MTSLYDRYVLPRLIRCACGAPAIHDKRAGLIGEARGRVLELGCGGGLNFAFYDPAGVSSVEGLDPSAPLRVMAARQARAASVPIKVNEGVAEAAPFEDGDFDTVVLTFTLCSVKDPAAVLSEIRRVLKPAGQLLFCEHGLSPEAGVQRWQGRLEPVWKRLAGGCHLTRPVGALIAAAGFSLVHGERGYLPRTPKIAGWVESGTAVLAA